MNIAKELEKIVQKNNMRQRNYALEHNLDLEKLERMTASGSVIKSDDLGGFDEQLGVAIQSVNSYGTMLSDIIALLNSATQNTEKIPIQDLMVIYAEIVDTAYGFTSNIEVLISLLMNQLDPEEKIYAQLLAKEIEELLGYAC